MPRNRSHTRDGSAGNDRLEPELLNAVEADNVTDLETILDRARQNGQFSETFLKIGLMRSAERNKPNATQCLLRAGANPNGMGKGNRTGPLMRAVERKNPTIVRILLDNTTIPVDRNEADKKGRTALMTAAWKNYTDILELLIRAGANINAKDNRDRNVLHNLAADTKEAHWGHTVINLLLGHNVFMDEKDEHGRTPLHWCCVTGRLSLAETLLKRPHGKRADINALEKRQKTPLHMAVSHGWEDLVDLLLIHGARIDLTSDGGWTALHNACEKGNERIVRTLLSAGVDCNARLLNGRTPLHVAADGLHVEVVRTLLANENVKKYARDGFGFTSFLLAAARKPTKDTTTKELLLAFHRKQRECVTLLAPTNHAESLSHDALGACQGFSATVTDFGNYSHGNKVTRISVFELLYGKKGDDPHKPAFEIIPKEHKATHFRWIHLPANNLAWIEALMTKHFVEEGHHDVDGFKAIERSFSLQHRGQQVHSHFMRPLCQTTPRAPPPEEVAAAETPDTELLFAPPQRITTGLSTETPTLLSSASESIPENHVVPPDGKENSIRPKKPRKANTRPNLGKKSSSRENSAPKGTATLRKTSSSADSATTKLKTNTDLHEVSPRANIVLFSPFLHFETSSARGKMHDAIEKARNRHNRRASEPSTKGLCSDEMLIRAHLSNTSLSLHVRRTLDQSFYHNIDTQLRDVDQVVYRFQHRNRKNYDSISTDPKIFMVDQLWMWVLGNGLIFTSFPERWQQPRNDPLNVLDGIIEDVNSRVREPVKSVYDLALTITARCSGIFDRHRVGDGEYQFLDMFESSIGEATDEETKLFREFNEASKKASEWLKTHRKPSRFRSTSSDDHLTAAEPTEDNFKYDDDRRVDPLFVDQLLDIGKETALLAESKDIRDEINMINKVLDDQKQVLKDLESSICDIYREEHKSQQEVKKRIRDQLKTVDVHVKDLDRMDKQAERIYDSITVLLDLKQKHANAFEARFARDQAAGTARQSQTIMVFTIVTIVFLPLSFIASFFTINISDFQRSGPDNNWALPMNYVSKFIFGIGFAISIPLILIALQLDRITDAWRTLVRKFPRQKDTVTQHIEETIEVYRKSVEVVSVSSGIARVKSRRRESTWGSGDAPSLPR